jgi:YVTN family beta-propeller protein
MPYSEGTRLPGERASRLSHLDILKSPVVKKFVNSFESLHLEIDSKEVTWQKMIMDENPMRLIFGIDGSFQTISSDTRPTKQLSFVKTALLKIDKSALSKIDREFPHPLILKDILSNSALYHATVFPLKNVSIDGMNTYHSIRHAIFESIKDDSLKGEIMNTLKWIVYEKWNNNKKDVPDFECPHCNKTVASLPYNAEVGLCRNCKKELLLTDMLGFHQVMGEDFAPESVATDYMNISVIDTNTFGLIDTDGNAGNGITPITVGSQPAFIAYDLINHEMYVANAGDDSVSVIDTTTNKVIDTITVGDFPTDIAYDIIHERMYVTNQGDSTVSVINLCL